MIIERVRIIMKILELYKNKLKLRIATRNSATRANWCCFCCWVRKVAFFRVFFCVTSYSYSHKYSHMLNYLIQFYWYCYLTNAHIQFHFIFTYTPFQSRSMSRVKKFDFRIYWKHKWNYFGKMINDLNYNEILNKCYCLAL